MLTMHWTLNDEGKLQVTWDNPAPRGPVVRGSTLKSIVLRPFVRRTRGRRVVTGQTGRRDDGGSLARPHYRKAV